MKTFPKILTTLALIGVIFLIFAALLQQFDRPLADKFGYTGVGLLGFNLFVVAVTTIIAIWNERFKSYILSSI